jgi:hypothetical protein
MAEVDGVSEDKWVDNDDTDMNVDDREKIVLKFICDGIRVAVKINYSICSFDRFALNIYRPYGFC